MSSSTLKIETLYGPLRAPNWPDDLIIRSLQQCGEWCEVETALLAPLVDHGETLWDVGAFLGTFSLGLSRHVELGHILAIDANPEVFHCLEHNLAHNFTGPDKATAIALSAGVGSQAGWIEPQADSDQANHGARSYTSTEEHDKPSATQCFRLRDLRAQYGDYDILKLDIEGMEEDALRGDLDYLKTRKPVIWAECNESLTSLKLLSVLKWLGYEPVYLAFPAFRRANFNSSDELIYPMAYEAALLAAPQDRLARLSKTFEGEDIICRPVRDRLELRRALFDTPRWCKPEWLGMNRAELIARLGRIGNAQKIGSFLAGKT